MKFRHLCWVIERLDEEGRTIATGIYNSIPVLLAKGVQLASPGCPVRLSLVKPDCNEGVVGSWNGPAFAGFELDIRTFVESDGFDANEVEHLVAELLGPQRVSA